MLSMQVENLKQCLIISKTDPVTQRDTITEFGIAVCWKGGNRSFIELLLKVFKEKR